MPLNGDCKTISAGPDKPPSYLTCAAPFFGNPPVNNTTYQVSANLLGCAGANTRSMLVVGHGAPGLMKSGNGDSSSGASTLDQIIALYTRPKWITYISQLKGRCSELSLIGCDVGANDTGADLLVNIANAVNCPVNAPTYLVWCGGGNVYLDAKARWQRATPGNRPTPIPIPTVALTDMKELFIGRAGMERIPLDAIQSLVVDKLSLTGEKRSRTFTGDEAISIVQTIAFDQPIEIQARPAAIVTGELTVVVDTSGGKRTLSFTIYNDRLFESNEHQGIFYESSSAFGQAVMHLV
jgi:hypothetical protein